MAHETRTYKKRTFGTRARQAGKTADAEAAKKAEQERKEADARAAEEAARKEAEAKAQAEAAKKAKNTK